MSSHLPTMLLAFVVTLVLSLGLTALVRRVALRRGLVDVPGEARRVHRVAVPRLGGLAMFAAFAVGVLLTFVFDVRTGKFGNENFEGSRVLLMLAGAGIITVVMAVDDVRNLRPTTRLLWQIGAALLVIMPSIIWPGGPNIRPDGTIERAGTVHYDQGAGVLALSVQSPFGVGGAIEMPLVIAVIFTIVWLVGMTNTINWIDGLDGLAAGVSVVACIVLFIITWNLQQYTLAYIPLILGAAILGFLPFNIHPARIFMGDSGAMFLGFTLAVISLIGGAKLAAALLVLGIPILDGIYLVIYRLYRGRSPMSPDRSHLHHRLLDLGFSQQQVVLIFYALAAAFGVLGILPGDFRFLKLVALLVMAAILIALLIYVARKQFDRVPTQE